MRIRAYLVLLAVSVVLPFLAFAGGVAYLFAERERRAVEEGLVSASRALAAAVDEHVRKTIDSLKIVAASELLKRGELDGFYRYMGRATEADPDLSMIYLADVQGRILYHTDPQSGAAQRSVGDREYVRQVLRTRAPAVSHHLLDSRLHEGKVIPAAVPVIIDGELRYVLCAALDPRVFMRILVRYDVPDHWRVAILDANGVILARSHDAARFVGQPATPEVRAETARRASGAIVATTKEGALSLAGFTRGEEAGWTVIVGSTGPAVASLVANRGLRDALAVGLALAIVAFVGTAWVGWRMSRPMLALVGSARDIGRGAVISPESGSGLREADEVQREMAASSRLLQDCARERDEAQRRAAEAHARLRHAIDSLSDGFALFDAQDRLALCNSAFTGYHAGAIAWYLGMSYRELLVEAMERVLDPSMFAGDPQAWLEQRMRLHREGGDPIEIKYRDGRWAHVSEYRIGSDVVQIRSDITALKRAVQEAQMLGGRQARLAELGQLALRQPQPGPLFEAAAATAAEMLDAEFCAVYELDRGGRSFVMKAGHGWSAGVVGHVGEPNDAGSLCGHVLGAGEPEAVVDLGADGRFAYHGFLAAHGIAAALCAPLKTVEETFGALCVYTRTPRTFTREDIHFLQALANVLGQALARRRAEEAFAQAVKMEAVGRLTGGVAHDYNNILTVILGNAEALCEELADRPAQREAALLIREGAERSAEMTRRLLAFARRQTLEPREIDVNAIVGGIEGLLRKTIGEDIRIEKHLAPGLRRALADPAQLEAALVNLVVNSRDAMPDGGRIVIETANVRLDEAYAAAHADVRVGDYVCIEVTDSGIGMPPEVLASAFEPYFTTKAVGKGTGLGLSSVHGFVKQSGGHIKIYSEPGMGTAVKLYLPSVPEEAGPAPDGERQERPGALPRGGERILLVEDDAMVRKHALMQLQGLGYDVVEAPNGPVALDLFTSDPNFDLLFTDVVMPGGMNGRQLAEAVRRLRPGMKVLYTSGYTENVIVHHGRVDAGLVLLHKPYTRTQLALKIRAALDRPPEAPPPS